MFKLIVAFALVAAVNCVGYETAVPSAYEQPIVKEEISSPAQYQFAYAVHDSVTGDSKDHIEKGNGDAVEGEYSLIDADGFKRIVKYTADSVNGFNAVVERQPISAPALVSDLPIVKSAAPVANSAIVLTRSVPVNYAYAPLVSSAPAQVVYRSAPLPYAAGFFGGLIRLGSSGPLSFTQF